MIKYYIVYEGCEKDYVFEHNIVNGRCTTCGRYEIYFEEDIPLLIAEWL